MEDFSDIMALPHHVSKTRRPMPQADRAVQFAAFEALTGYDEDIGETARLTDVRAELSEDDLAALDAAMQQLIAAEGEHPAASVIRFQPDARKDGGRYVTYTGVFRHYDEAENILYFADGTAVPAREICGLTLAEQPPPHCAYPVCMDI